MRCPARRGRPCIVPQVFRPVPMAASPDRVPPPRSPRPIARQRHLRGGPPMVLSVSAVLLLGVFVFLLWRSARLPLWQAAICALFGYLLAFSSLGPHIGDDLRSLAQFIAGLHL